MIEFFKPIGAVARSRRPPSTDAMGDR